MYIDIAKEHYKITMSDGNDDIIGINIYLGALAFVLGKDCPTYREVMEYVKHV